MVLRCLVGSSTGIMVTTYGQLRLNADLLLGVDWGYVVLDEGHKIRNPDAHITLVAKQVRGPTHIVRCSLSERPTRCPWVTGQELQTSLL